MLKGREVQDRKNTGEGVEQTTRVPLPVAIVTRCLSLGSSHRLSEPSFPHLLVALPIRRGCSEPTRGAGSAGGRPPGPLLTVPHDSPCSDSDEEESTREDNTALLRFHLKYEADVLFTRWGGGEDRLGEAREK